VRCTEFASHCTVTDRFCDRSAIMTFRQVNKKSGNRLRQQLVDDVTREAVGNEDKGRGYEYSKNAYILVDDDELDAIAVESTHTIEIDSFVPREQIDEPAGRHPGAA
jgi:DNA end-binding protein Ku